MYVYKDISGLTRAASGALLVYMLLHLLFGGGMFYAEILAPQPDYDLVRFIARLAFPSLLAFFVAAAIVGCWFYRACANAHALGGDLTVTPGWAVGWYFVPFANWFKPYQVMKEIWLASHYRGDWGLGAASPLLGWWWGLWVILSLLGYAAMQEVAPDFRGWVSLASGLVGVPLSLIFVTILTRVTEAQKVALHQEVFA